jgi:hypothetical protein
MKPQQKSLTDVALVEAIARQTDTLIVPQPSLPGKERRLTSRFLGTSAGGDLVLAVPMERGKKVFISAQEPLGLIFSMQDFTFQAQTAAIDHCLYPLQPARRVDALVVRRPEKVLALKLRQHPRWEPDLNHPIHVSLWPMQDLMSGLSSPPRKGRLMNVSVDGMGVLFESAPPYATCDQVIVRLEDARHPEQLIFLGVVKHCTGAAGGGWTTGLGDVREIGLGQVVPVMDSLANLRTMAPVGRATEQ